MLLKIEGVYALVLIQFPFWSSGNVSYFRCLMTFYEKYKQLQNEAFLTELLTDTVYSTMCLENQEVSKLKVNEIVLSTIREHQLKGHQFPANQTHQ